MPIYEYRRADGSTFELLQSFSDDPLTADPETGEAVERVLHAPAVHFKGKGFYNTDYGTRKRQRESASSEGSASSSDSSKSAADSSANGSSGSSDSTKSDSKGGSTKGESGKAAKPVATAS